MYLLSYTYIFGQTSPLHTCGQGEILVHIYFLKCIGRFLRNLLLNETSLCVFAHKCVLCDIYWLTLCWDKASCFCIHHSASFYTH